jgi:predicted regulator of Ras-like GTPase activity (Roadblock/LC7/MglB family)
MSLQGNIKEMSVADLIQHNCIDRKTGKLTIEHLGQQAILYFNNGGVVHAALGGNEGEEVVYQTLAWEEGAFTLTSDEEAPKTSIERSWSGLLMEGAKRLDEQNFDSDLISTNQIGKQEEPGMASKMDEILQDMSNEMNGFEAAAVAGMDGMNIAQFSKSKIDPESVTAQLTIFLKLAGSSGEKTGMGNMEDIIIQTEKYYLMNVFLPGDNQHFLSAIVDRKTGSLGNMRLICKIYAERFSKTIPR